MSSGSFKFQDIILFSQEIHKNWPGIRDANGLVHFDRFANLAVKPRVKAELGEFEIRIAPSSDHLDYAKGVVATDLTSSPKRSNILYACTLNTCRKRFTIVKELCQLYIDPKFNCRTKTTADQLREALTDLKLSSDVGELKRATIVPEKAAFILAVEVMLPWTNRSGLKDMKNSGSSHFDIAKAFMVPEYVIDEYFGGYGVASELFNELLSQ